MLLVSSHLYSRNNMATDLSAKEKTRQLLITWDKNLYDIFRRFSRFILVCSLLSLIVFPCVAAVLSLAKTTAPEFVLAVFLTLWLVTGGITFYNNALPYRLASQINPEFVQDLRIYLSDQHTISHLVSQDTVVDFSLATLVRLINNIGAYDLSKDLEKLLQPLISAQKTALGFESDETIYNYVVYMFNVKTNKMELKWRKCHPTLEQDRHDRDWNLGTGHPGITYFAEKVWIMPNATESEQLPGLFSEEFKERDLRFYRSFIAIPIRPHISDDHAVVAFIITSSQEKQFSEKQHLRLSNIYGLILSIYFLHYLNSISTSVNG